MINYLDMDAARIEAAHQTFMDRDGTGFAARVNERQWAIIARDEADMDAAYVIAVEQEAALETA